MLSEFRAGAGSRSFVENLPLPIRRSFPTLGLSLQASLHATMGPLHMLEGADGPRDANQVLSAGLELEQGFRSNLANVVGSNVAGKAAVHVANAF